MWGVGIQFSFDCLHDEEYVNLLAEAHCGLAFIGLESLSEPSLAFVHKRHNKVLEYQELFQMLKNRRILTFTGLMLALDEDTPQYYEDLPRNLQRVDPSSILMSIAIPIPGTGLHKRVSAEGRIFDEDQSHYDGDHLVFQPKTVSSDDVFHTYNRINRVFYSWPAIIRRWWRLITSYSGEENIFIIIFRTIFITYFFFDLNLFEREHAERRVYPLSGEVVRQRLKDKQSRKPAPATVA